jgi:hypothetical protein
MKKRKEAWPILDAGGLEILTYIATLIKDMIGKHSANNTEVMHSNAFRAPNL